MSLADHWCCADTNLEGLGTETTDDVVYIEKVAVCLQLYRGRKPLFSTNRTHHADSETGMIRAVSGSARGTASSLSV